MVAKQRSVYGLGLRVRQAIRIRISRSQRWRIRHCSMWTENWIRPLRYWAVVWRCRTKRYCWIRSCCHTRTWAEALRMRSFCRGVHVNVSGEEDDPNFQKKKKTISKCSWRREFSFFFSRCFRVIIFVVNVVWVHEMQFFFIYICYFKIILTHTHTQKYQQIFIEYIFFLNIIDIHTYITYLYDL